MIFQIVIENGVKKLVPLTADAGAGLPVGFIAPAYKKGNYSGWLYLDGRDTTGTSEELSTHYPVLYAILGSNVLPDYREFALVGAEQNTTDTIADHDVYTEGQAKDDQLQFHNHQIAQAWNQPVSPEIAVSVPIYSRDMISLVTPTQGMVDDRHGTVTRGKRKAVYFYIKATSGLSENAQDNVINTLNEQRSYSTEEHLTGKKWIDGKPIYSRSFSVAGIGTETWTNVTNASWINNIARIINCEVSANDITGYGGHPKAKVENGYLQTWELAGYGAGVMTLEYTKTTD